MPAVPTQAGVAHVRELAPRGWPVRSLSAQRRRLWGMAIQHGVFAVAPVLVVLARLHIALAQHALGVDFAHGPWVAGHDVLAGATPWAPSYAAELRGGLTFVYPAAAAVAAAPFALLPRSLATDLFVALSLAAVIGALRCCGVRDWRVIGAVFLWPSVTSGLQTANVTLVFVCGVAAAWRWRDRPLVAGALIALMISLKPFVWPLALWLAATRRWSALRWTLGWGAAINLVAWSIVGWRRVGAFVALLRADTRFLDHSGYSLMRVLGGNADPLAIAVALVLAGSLIAAAFVVARRGEERSAFSLCILASLLACPLVWLHDFALLIPVLALARPRLSAWWILPTALVFPISDPAPWQVLVALGVAGAVAAASLTGERVGSTPTPRLSPAGWG